MEASPITTILSDVGGVLIKNYDATIDDVRMRVGLPEAIFLPIWQREVKIFGSYGDEARLWKAFAAQGGATIEPDGSIFTSGFEDNLQIYHQVIEVMEQSGKTLSILSNTIPPHAKVLSNRGVYDAFDPQNVFLSHEIHEQKPDLAAYAVAIEKLETNPENILFIDDSEANLVTARRMGMQTLLSAGDEPTIVASLTKILSRTA
ncbi:HAD-IA family hydrolase [Candidatus Saccharibacteria bacterium]|nr:HAD-IA family hydrolase [Candidatus Saccharibacteria bacterium]